MTLASTVPSLTSELVERISLLDEGSIDDRARDAARSLLLDYVAVCAEGSRSTTAATMRRVAATIVPAGKAMPVIGVDGDLPGTAAAMANAVAGHTTEFDDVHNASSTHPGVVVFSALFGAAAQLAEPPGDALLLAATVAGYEAMCRVGRAAGPAEQYGKHFHPTATAGAIGAAATASRVLGLDRSETLWALGIAADLAAGGMQFLVDGAWTKRLHPAVAARHGIDAALLAAAGFVGTEDGIGGEHGFLATFGGHPGDPARVLDGWPDGELEVRRTSVKAHACCRYKQGPIDGLLEIRRTAALEPGEVDAVEIGLPTVALPIVALPADEKRRPRSVVDAQFSMPFGAAAALVHGRAGLREYVDEALQDERLLALMDRVVCVGDPDLDVDYPQRWRSWAKVTTRSGAVHRATIDEPKGDPGNPFSTDELRQKFDDLASPVYGGSARARIVGATNRFGEPGAFDDLLGGLRATRRTGPSRPGRRAPRSERSTAGAV